MPGRPQASGYAQGARGERSSSFSGMTLGASRVQSALSESGALAFSRGGKVLHRWAETGLFVGGEETSRRAAILLLCFRRTQRGGKAGVSRQDWDRGGAEAVGDPPLDLAPVDVHFVEKAFRGRVQISTVGEDRKHHTVS